MASSVPRLLENDVPPSLSSSGEYTWAQQSSDSATSSAFADAESEHRLPVSKSPTSPLDPRHINPALNASLVTEILNLRRELDHKNASIDELEAGLQASNTEVEAAKAQMTRLTRETAVQQKQFDEAEKHLHRIAEELIGERDQALSRTHDLRARLNALNSKTRRQEDDFQRWQEQWEQKSSSWVAERHVLESRMNLTEDLLRNVLAQMHSKQQAEQDAANQDGQAQPIDTSIAAGVRDIETRHRRGLSANSTFSLPRPLSAHSVINPVNGEKSLADEFSALDEEDDFDEFVQLDQTAAIDPATPERRSHDGPRSPPSHSPTARMKNRFSPRMLPAHANPAHDPVRLLPVGMYPPRPPSPAKQGSKVLTSQPLEPITEQVTPTREAAEDYKLQSSITDVSELPLMCDPEAIAVTEAEAHNESIDPKQRKSQVPSYANSGTQTEASQKSYTDSSMQTEEIRIDLRNYDSTAPLELLMENIMLSRGSTKSFLRNAATGKETGRRSPLAKVTLFSQRVQNRPQSLMRPVSTNSATSKPNHWAGMSGQSTTLPAFPEEDHVEQTPDATLNQVFQHPEQPSRHGSSPLKTETHAERSGPAYQSPPFPVPDRTSSRIRGKLSGMASMEAQQFGSPSQRRARPTGLRKARSSAELQPPMKSPLRRKRASTQTDTRLSSHYPQKSMTSLLNLEELARPQPLSSHPPHGLSLMETRDEVLVDTIASATIGAWVWKYTSRRSPSALFSIDGNKLYKEGSRRKHYVWLSPQDRVLMWASKKPAAESASVSRTKHKRKCFKRPLIFVPNNTVHIRTVLDVKDDSAVPKTSNNGMGCYHRSIIVLSPSRSVKFTATNEEEHYSWLMALNYLADTAEGPPQVPRIPPSLGLPGSGTIIGDPRADELIKRSVARAHANISNRPPPSQRSSIPRSPVQPERLYYHNGAIHRAQDSFGTNRPDTGLSVGTMSVPRYPRASSARPSSANAALAPSAFSLRSFAGRRTPSMKRSASARPGRPPTPTRPAPTGEMRLVAFVDSRHIDDDESEDEEDDLLEDYEPPEEHRRGRSRQIVDPFRGF